jgi:NodT family efflux transporter outer membrane factor (OMF) lipoprotein
MTNTIKHFSKSAAACLYFLSSAALLSACATGKPPRSSQVILPESYAISAANTESTTLDQWWLLYSDAELNRLMQAAQQQGFSVREAQARLVEAQSLRAVALSRFSLQGNIQGSAGYRETDASNSSSFGVTTSNTGTSKTADISLPISWELDFFGRRAATDKSAQADLDVAQFDIEKARSAIAAEVARSLFQVRGISVQRDDARESLRIQNDLMMVVSERARRGIAAESEVDRVAADMAQAEAQAADFDGAFIASRRALLLVLGLGTAPLSDTAQIDTLGDAPSIPASLPSELIARRPDIRMAAARITKATGNVRLAELDFFPKFTLSPSIGLSAQRGAFDTNTSFWSVAVNLMIPVLDRPRLQSQLNVEGARAEQAVLAYERTVQTAFSEVDQSMTRLQADRQRVAILSVGETRARKAFEAARQRYTLGFANLQELLDGERTWRATRSSLNAAKLDALQRSVQVFQALGGGWNASTHPSDNQG